MKLKKIALMTMAAIYAGGAGYVAATNQPHSGVDLSGEVPVGVDVMQLYKNKKIANAEKSKINTVPLRSSGLANMQFKPKALKDKIKVESDLTGKHTYIVRMNGQAAATYNGEIRGLAATKGLLKTHRMSAPTAHVTDNAQAINAYTNHLMVKQNQVISQAGIQPKQQFTMAINAFTAEMTQDEAIRLAAMSDVAFVQRSTKLQLHTDVGPEHIGAKAVWDGSATQGMKYQGEGMVVGIIDTGINTDHPSFADIGGDGYDHTNPLGEGNYLGGCAIAQFADKCNDKLIGVYTHNSITGGYPADLQFGEDYNGHGSHVASTVAGNVLHDVDVVGTQFGGGAGIPIGVQMPTISGVAPHANIISYQVCTDDGCPGDAILFAIEQAIKDGVDAINMSIGGAESFPWDDAFEMAFLSAREAGIAVALSAGNSGAAYGTDSLYTVDHTSPWVLNVAATTHSRSITIKDKALNNFMGGDSNLVPTQLDGAGISAEFTGNFVIAASAGDARCLDPFPTGTFQADDIVICERGENARVEKAANVQAGGAGGFVLYNTYEENDQVNDDSYPIPGIHLTANQYFGSWNQVGLLPWLQSAADGEMLSGTITASTASRDINPDDADWLATFSSRGPSSTVDELFSPGIAAPGVNIFAAWSDENPFNEYADTRDYNAISGTSMASPHIAGMMTLIRQARPDWTASQIQSAIQMTADKNAIKTPHPMTGETKVAGVYRAGHGLANVERAINAGLIMDETADNFRRANPHNGGLVRDLNLPQLINNDCGRTCTWTRTVTATKDGTWNANIIQHSESPLYWDWSLDPSAKIKVTPAQFTLKAGESITLTVTGNFNESDMAWYDGTVQSTTGEIELVATDPSIPTSQWPFKATFKGKTLPNTINITASADNASNSIENVPFGVPGSSLNGVGYRPVEATVQAIELSRLGSGMRMVDDEGFFLTDVDYIKTVDVNVPENAAVLRAELTGVIGSKIPHALNTYVDADILVLRDFNNDGRLHYSEAICGSQLPQTTKGEYCSIENPDAGDYVIMVQNYLLYPWDNVDTVELTHSVVTKEVDSSISLSFEDTQDKNSTLTINWDMPMEEGKTYYSAAAIHAGNNSEGSLTLVPIKITRGMNTVAMQNSQDAARVGDIIDMNMIIQANISGTDRHASVTATLSEGLKMVEGSLSDIEGLTVTETGFTYEGMQSNTAGKATNYVITTNKTDPMCRTPWEIEYPNGEPVDGKYVDLRKFEIEPSWGSFFEVNEWGWGSWVHDVEVPSINGNLQPFDNGDYFVTDKFILSARGWLQLDYLQYNPWDILPHSIHLELPMPDYSTPPDFIVAPLWNAMLDENWNQSWVLSQYAPFWNADKQEGVSVAYYDDYTLVEWDNAATHDQSFDENWQEVQNRRDDTYDFQVFLKERTDNAPGKYEMIMAYDNVDFASQDGNGSIGVRGYSGPRAGWNPLNGHTGVSYAFNDLKDKVEDGLIVCYNVEGPSASEVQVKFKAEVLPSALGVNQSVSLDGAVEGVSAITTHYDIQVASNLNIVAISDHMTEENTALEGIRVSYTDNDGGMSANTITVTGDNITATVHGHESGAMIDIMPAQDFHGETMVTVTVSDNLFPNDKSSTSFMLTVNSDGVDPTPPATPESPVEPAPEPESDSGSLGFLSLTVLALIGLRRKKFH